VLLHNDLAAEHVLIDPANGNVTGVIDWSDMAIGDPLVDFAGLFHWGGDSLVDSALACYSGPLSDVQLRCARYLGACRGAMDVAFGLDRNRPEYVRAGLTALRLCTGT
jgi:aminoglycoside phosphotransferase (APT) family kinase protein